MYYINQLLNKKEIHIKFISENEKIDSETTCYSNPIDVAKAAFALKQNLEKDSNKINIYVYLKDNIFFLKTKLQYKLLHWADDEYKRLPKCKECRRILAGERHSNWVFNNNVYCSESCRIKVLESQEIKNNEETEFYF